MLKPLVSHLDLKHSFTEERTLAMRSPHRRPPCWTSTCTHPMDLNVVAMKFNFKRGCQKLHVPHQDYFWYSARNQANRLALRRILSPHLNILRKKFFNCKEVPLKKLCLSAKTCSAYFYLNFFVIIFRLCFSSATHLNTIMYLFYLVHFHIQRIVEAEIQTVFVTGT